MLKSPTLLEGKAVVVPMAAGPSSSLPHLQRPSGVASPEESGGGRQLLWASVPDGREYVTLPGPEPVALFCVCDDPP